MYIPSINLIVIRVRDLEVSRVFYSELGLQFERERHGDGPEHYAAELHELVFELYPARKSGAITNEVRLGFQVERLAEVLTRLQKMGGDIVTDIQEMEGGKHAVVSDPDGHRVVLTEAVNS